MSTLWKALTRTYQHGSGHTIVQLGHEAVGRGRRGEEVLCDKAEVVHLDGRRCKQNDDKDHDDGRRQQGQ